MTETARDRVFVVGAGAYADALTEPLARAGYEATGFAPGATEEQLTEAARAGDALYGLIFCVGDEQSGPEPWGPEWRARGAERVRDAFTCTRALARLIMKARRGRILYIVSGAGLNGAAGNEALSVGSGGVAGMARTVARELASRNVTVNTVAYGPASGEGTPLGKPLSPGAVASACLYLLSEQAETVTGQVLAVDGGWVMR